MNIQDFNSSIKYLEETYIDYNKLRNNIINDYNNFETNLNESFNNKTLDQKWKFAKWSLKFLKEESLTRFLTEYYTKTNNPEAIRKLSSMNKKEKLSKIYDLIATIPDEKREEIVKNIRVSSKYILNRENDIEKNKDGIKTGLGFGLGAGFGSVGLVAAAGLPPAAFLLSLPLFAIGLGISIQGVRNIKNMTRLETLNKINKSFEPEYEKARADKEEKERMIKKENEEKERKGADQVAKDKANIERYLNNSFRKNVETKWNEGVNGEYMNVYFKKGTIELYDDLEIMSWHIVVNDFTGEDQYRDVGNGGLIFKYNKFYVKYAHLYDDELHKLSRTPITENPDEVFDIFDPNVISKLNNILLKQEQIEKLEFKTPKYAEKFYHDFYAYNDLVEGSDNWKEECYITLIGAAVSTKYIPSNDQELERILSGNYKK